MTTPSTYKKGYPPEKYSTVPCITETRDPTTSDLYHPTAGGFYPTPTIWCNKSTGACFILGSITSGTTANWENFSLNSGGTDARKGQVTLVAGTATVTTTAVEAGSVIALTIVTLGTVTDPMPLYVTIDPGVDFDITSEDATDTSTINWAIVG